MSGVARFGPYPLIDFQGRPVAPGSLVSVTKTDGTAATLFSDSAGTVSITSPLHADNNSSVSFVAAPGDYNVQHGGMPVPILVSVPDTRNLWTLSDVIAAGVATVANNVYPPGVRVPVAGVPGVLAVRAGTAPVGAALNVRINRNGADYARLSIAAGATASGVATGVGGVGVPLALSVGQILTFDVLQVGSTTAGSDVAFDITILG